MKTAGSVRWVRALMAFLLLFGMFAPTLIWISELKAYALSPETLKVIGAANPNLGAKFSFDKEQNKWQFNKNGVASLASSIAKQQPGQGDAEGAANALTQLAAKQVGGAGKNDQSLYSVDLSVKAEDGIVYYDNVTRLSFKMVPDFVSRDAKLVKNRIVYPIGSNGRVVYTAKSNGLKEDIVLDKFAGDTLRYGYKLELPEGLEARVLDDGSIGVYSASPALYGSITFSNDEDRARVMEARKTGTKDYLVFGIPAPYIKDQTGKVGHTRYELRGSNLTVVATGLKDLSYPLSVDPSVTVTSSAEFQTGNDEGMISFGTSGQITRDAVTGGTIGAWNFTDNSVNRGATQGSGSGAANGMIAARNAHRTVAYNGYMYALGGDTQGTSVNTVERAPINSDGTLGTWVSSGTLPEARSDHVSFAYNGYMYIVGGYTGGGSYSADVKFAPINADGTLGAWASTTSLPVGRINHAALAYDGRMYVINGCTTAAGNCNTANPTAVVYCADILATGQVGAWGTCNTSGLTARDGFSAVAYNGYIYGMGGCATYSLFACNSLPRHVQYAKINSDGTLGNWVTSTALFTTDRGSVNIVASGGYIYLTGDSGTDFVNDMQYVPIYANGSIGTWSTTTSYGQTRNLGSLSVYNNYLYMIGGCTARSAGLCSSTKNDVQFASINPAGVAAGYVAETDTIHPTTLRSSATVAYNGYLYLLGGNSDTAAGTMTNNVYFTSLNSDGSTGAWTTTSAFTQYRSGAVGVAYNGYMYVMGGWHNIANTNCSAASSDYCDDIQKAPINPTNGTLGAWSNAGGPFTATPRAGMGVAVYDDYMYVFGGGYGSGGSTVTNETRVGQIQSNGDVTGWVSTGTMVNASAAFAFSQSGPYAYAAGGRSPTAYSTVVQYAVFNNGTATWGSTTSLPSGREDLSGSVYNGYMYVTGGHFGGGGTQMLNETLYARICLTTATTDGCNGTIGTLGTWRTTSSFTTIRSSHMTASYNGYLYIMGGCSNWGLLGTCNTVLNDLQYAKINNGGSGITGTWGSAGGSGLGANADQVGLATYAGRYVYVTGGCTSLLLVTMMGCSALSGTTQYAPISADTGTVGSYTTASNQFTTARYGHGSFEYKGYLYVLGGCVSGGNFCSGMTNDIQFAAINPSTGNLGAWASAGTSIPGGNRYGLVAMAYNGYIYVVGGCTTSASSNCTGYDNTVRYAAINPDGTISNTWSSSTFTTGRFGHSSMIYNSKLYVVGGCSAMASNDCTSVLRDIQVAPVNADGSLGSWSSAGKLQTGRFGAALTAQNGYVYLSGGCSATASGGCSAINPNIEFAAISPNGPLLRWMRSPTTYATPRLWHQGFMANGYMYVTTGVDAGGNLQSDAQLAALQAQSHTGKYSKLITINPATDIAGVYFNGTVSNSSSVSYKVAPSTGVFSSSTPAAQGSGAEPTPQCGAGTIYYTQIMVALDDHNRTTFPDSGASNITDITVYYRLSSVPPPNLRLTGGKWFYNEAQLPLDICKS